MKKFEHGIREKYAREVNPVYSEQAWNDFAAKAGIENKSSRRKVWWMLLLGLLMSGTIAGYFLWTSTQKDESSIALYTEDRSSYPEIPDNKKLAAERNNLSNSSDQKEIRNSNNKDNPEEVEEKRNIPTGINKKDDEIDATYSDVKMKTIYKQNSNSNPGEDLLNSSIQNDIEKAIPEENISDVVDYTGSLSEGGQRSFVPEIIEIEVLPIEKELTFDFNSYGLLKDTNLPIQVYKERNKRISTQFLLGSGITRHRSVINERQHNAQLNLTYFLGNRINIISSIGYFQQSFESKVLYQNLGLRSSDYQPRSVKLDRVNSDAQSLEMSVGVEWLPINYRNFSLSGGTSLAYSNRYNQDLVYDFKNGESYIPEVEFGNENDIMNRWSLRMGLGVKYALSPGWGLVTQTYYQKSILNMGIHYPSQWRMMLGIEKRW